MSDETIRRALVGSINTEVKEMPDARAGLEAKHGEVWDTKEMQENFEVHGFMAPFVKVTRKSDQVDGLLMFSHQPRFYFAFEPTAHDRDSGIRVHTSL